MSPFIKPSGGVLWTNVFENFDERKSDEFFNFGSRFFLIKLENVLEFPDICVGAVDDVGTKLLDLRNAFHSAKLKKTF